MEHRGQLLRELLLRGALPLHGVARPGRRLRPLQRVARLPDRVGRGRGRGRERADGGGGRRHPEGDERGQLAARRADGRAGDRRAGREARRGVRRPARRADGGARAAGRGEPRRGARARWRSRTRTAPTASGSATVARSTVQDMVPFGKENGEPARLGRHLPPGRRDAHDRQGDQVAVQRVRDGLRARGQVRFLESASPGPPDWWRPQGSRARASAAARSTVPQLALLASAARPRGRGLGGHRRPDGRHGVHTRHGPRRTRLLPHGLGGDDGRDDVPLRRSHGARCTTACGQGTAPRGGRRARTRPRYSSPAISSSGRRRAWLAYGLLELGRDTRPGVPGVGRGGSLAHRRRDRRGRALPGHAVEAGVPRQVPQPDDVPRRALAARARRAHSNWASGTAPGAWAAAGP